MITIKDSENGKVLARGYENAVYYMAGYDGWQQSYWRRIISELDYYANKLGVEQQYDEFGEELIIATPKRCNKKEEWSFSFTLGD